MSSSSRPEWVQKLLDNPGLYSIGMTDDPLAAHNLVLSRDGKLYSFVIDAELSPDRFNPGAFLQKTLLRGRLASIAGHPQDEKLVRLKRGECIKCNAGPLRESCAYPEACEHPGRELAFRLNQALLKLAARTS